MLVGILNADNFTEFSRMRKALIRTLHAKHCAASSSQLPSRVATEARIPSITCGALHACLELFINSPRFCSKRIVIIYTLLRLEYIHLVRARDQSTHFVEVVKSLRSARTKFVCPCTCSANRLNCLVDILPNTNTIRTTH